MSKIVVKLKVRDVFHDKQEDKERLVGDEFEVDKDRAVELLKLGLVEILEIRHI